MIDASVHNYNSIKWKTRSTCIVTRNRWWAPAAKHGWFASDLSSLPACKMHQCAMPKQINPRESRLPMLHRRSRLRLLIFAIWFFTHRPFLITMTSGWPYINVPPGFSPYHSRRQDEGAIDLSLLHDRRADNRSKWYVSLAAFFRMIRSIYCEIKPWTITHFHMYVLFLTHIFSVINFLKYNFFRCRKYLCYVSFFFRQMA